MSFPIFFKPGPPEPFLKTSASEAHPALSPDGRWLAYVSNVSGAFETYVTPFPGPGGKWQVSASGGGAPETAPAWAPSGRELFYRHEDRVMVVDIVTQPELRLGKPRVLFEGPYRREFAQGRQYDVTADGQRFVMVKRPDEPIHQQINVILNWYEELKRLVPTEN